MFKEIALPLLVLILIFGIVAATIAMARACDNAITSDRMKNQERELEFKRQELEIEREDWLARCRAFPSACPPVSPPPGR